MALVKCENCKHNYSDRAKKCPICGYKPKKKDGGRRKADKGSRERREKSKAAPLALSVVLVLAAALAAWFVLSQSQEKKVIAYINKGDYASAAQYVNDNLADDEEAIGKLRETVLQKIREYEEGYESEAIQKEDALKALEGASAFHFVKKEAQEARDRVEELSRSREAYADALQKEEAKEYAAAMEQFAKVIERDANYKAAKEKYEACFQTIKSEAMQKAEELRVQQSFAEAVAILEACQAVRADEEVAGKLAGVLQEKQDYDNALAEQERIQREQEEAQLAQERENRKNELQKIIKVSRITCSEPNSQGGVDLFINFKNMSSKKIQSVIFRVVALGGSGEALQCKKTNVSVFGASIQGPFQKGEGLLDQNRYWANAWYNKDIKGVKLEGVEIQYSKGETVAITGDEVAYVTQ